MHPRQCDARRAIEIPLVSSRYRRTDIGLRVTTHPGSPMGPGSRNGGLQTVLVVPRVGNRGVLGRVKPSWPTRVATPPQRIAPHTVNRSACGPPYSGGALPSPVTHHRRSGSQRLQGRQCRSSEQPVRRKTGSWRKWPLGSPLQPARGWDTHRLRRAKRRRLIFRRQDQRAPN